MEKTEKQNNGYLLGIVGALIGGAIGTLPWILCYVYANMMYSILAIVIAIGAFKGYELMKGKLDKKVPIIIAAISVLAITIATLVVIPHLLLIKEYGKTSMELFNTLYAFDEFKSAIIQDYIYSLLFTGLGISGVIANIKRGIANGDSKIDLTAPAYTPTNDEISEIKEIFEKKNATNKDNTISKDTVKDEIKGKEQVFNYLKARGIIVSKNKGYYYSLENEQNPNKRVIKIIIWSIVATFSFIALAIIIAALG